MKVRLVDISKDEGWAEIHLVDNDTNKARLNINVAYNGCYMEMFYNSMSAVRLSCPANYELREQKNILITNISEIINVVFLLFECDRGEIEYIRFDSRIPEVLIKFSDN